MDEKLRQHEEAVRRARDQKAASYDAKLARITSMELRRGEMLDDLARMRTDAYLKYDEMKGMAYLSTVKNNDDMLRRLLEELVPRLSSSARTPRSNFHSSAGGSRRRALSADPTQRVDRSPLRVRPSSARGRPRSAPRERGIRAKTLESPGRSVGIGGAVRRRLSPSNTFADKDKGSSDSRSASTASLGNSGILSASYGSASWESMSLSSPTRSPVGHHVSQLLASARSQNPTDSGSACASPIARVPAAPVDCPLCYTTPRRPRRGVEIATYAKIARGIPAQRDDMQLLDSALSA